MAETGGEGQGEIQRDSERERDRVRQRERREREREREKREKERDVKGEGEKGGRAARSGGLVWRESLPAAGLSRIAPSVRMSPSTRRQVGDHRLE